jgi:hypothetical protein
VIKTASKWYEEFENSSRCLTLLFQNGSQWLQLLGANLHGASRLTLLLLFTNGLLMEVAERTRQSEILVEQAIIFLGCCLSVLCRV